MWWAVIWWEVNGVQAIHPRTLFLAENNWGHFDTWFKQQTLPSNMQPLWYEGQNPMSLGDDDFDYTRGQADAAGDFACLLISVSSVSNGVNWESMLLVIGRWVRKEKGVGGDKGWSQIWRRHAYWRWWNLLQGTHDLSHNHSHAEIDKVAKEIRVISLNRWTCYTRSKRWSRLFLNGIVILLKISDDILESYILATSCISEHGFSFPLQEKRTKATECHIRCRFSSNPPL